MLTASLSDIQSGDRVLRLEDVQTLTGLCKTHIHELINAGEFPRQFKLSRHGRAAGWLESEVRAYIASRAATRTGPRFVPPETQL